MKTCKLYRELESWAESSKRRRSPKVASEFYYNEVSLQVYYGISKGIKVVPRR